MEGGEGGEEERGAGEEGCKCTSCIGWLGTDDVPGPRWNPN